MTESGYWNLGMWRRASSSEESQEGVHGVPGHDSPQKKLRGRLADGQ